MAIFSEYAKDQPIYKLMTKNFLPRKMHWYPEDNFREAGVEEIFLKDFRDYWFARFFQSPYIQHDRPMPGAARYVKRIIKAGGRAVYLTGRDEPRMGEGTRQSLIDYDFPLDGENAILMMKQDPDQADQAYKTQALETIQQLGPISAFIEDFPELANQFYDQFPDAMVILMDSPHPPEAPNPHPELPKIKDFILPGDEHGPYLAVMTGLPATGKSTIARVFAGCLETEHFSTDKIRRELFPPSKYDREARYSHEAKTKVYSTLLGRTKTALRNGCSAVMDGTFLLNNRYELQDLACDFGATLVFVKTTCQEDEIGKRFDRRKTQEDFYSEAHADVYKRMKQKVTEGDKYLDVEDDPLVTEKKVPLIVFDTGMDTYHLTNTATFPDLQEKIAVDFPLYSRVR